MFFFSELCWGKATVDYTIPQQRKKEESERLSEPERNFLPPLLKSEPIVILPSSKNPLKALRLNIG